MTKISPLRIAVFGLAFLLALAGYGCGGASQEAKGVPSAAPGNGVKSAPPPGVSFTAPISLTLPDIGDTYLLQPESTGVASPEYRYRSMLPQQVKVDKTGLITVEGSAFAEVYITLVDGSTGEEVLTHAVFVAAGDMAMETGEAAD